MTGRSTQALIALTIAAIASAASFGVSGTPFGLMIGALGFATLLVPPLLSPVRDVRYAILLFIAIVAGLLVATIWGFVGLPFNTWLASALIVVCYVASLVGLSRLLARFTHSATISSTLVTLAGMLWLAWPIWLTAWPIGGRAVSWLVDLHPIFAINARMPSIIWTQSPVLYGLTTLGQDTSYALPNSIWPCAIAHAAIALATIPAAWWPAPRVIRLDGVLCDR